MGRPNRAPLFCGKFCELLLDRGGAGHRQMNRAVEETPVLYHHVRRPAGCYADDRRRNPEQQDMQSVENSLGNLRYLFDTQMRRLPELPVIAGQKSLMTCSHHLVAQPPKKIGRGRGSLIMTLLRGGVTQRPEKPSSRDVAAGPRIPGASGLHDRPSRRVEIFP